MKAAKKTAITLIAGAAFLYIGLFENDVQAPTQATAEADRGYTLQSPLDKFKNEATTLKQNVEITSLKEQIDQLQKELNRYHAAEEDAAKAAEEARKKHTSTFNASHYTAYCEGCSGTTATGIDIKTSIYTPDGYRVVAVDPSVIPLGTILQITYPDGTTFKAKAADTGGAIKGQKLDVLVASKEEAYTIGVKPVQVQILSE